MKNQIKVISLEGYNKTSGRPERADPIKQYPAKGEISKYFKGLYSRTIDRRKLPKVKGMVFHLYETKIDYRKKTFTLYLIYKNS